MAENKSIVFILPVVSQPRYSKRIKTFKTEGFITTVYSFERNYFKGNKYEFISLGKVEHGKYLKRVNVLVKAFFKLYKDKKKFKSTGVFYVFGLDNLVLLTILKKLIGSKTPIVYEIADIRKVMFGNKFTNKVSRQIEKWLMNGVSIVALTSPYYYSDFYLSEMGMNLEKFLIVENKLDESFINQLRPNNTFTGEKLKIGFFGLLRCQKSWDLLYKLAKMYPEKIEIHIRGYLMELKDFDVRVSELENIQYYGEYKSPDDLSEIYRDIDISMIGNVSTNINNGALALPNRYYESLFFRKPMIAHIGTAVGDRIRTLNVGWTLDFDNHEESIKRIINISKSEYDVAYYHTNVEEQEVISKYDNKMLVEKVSVLIK